MYHITVMFIEDGYMAACTVGKGYDGVVYPSMCRFPNPQEAAISALENAMREKAHEFPLSLENASEHTKSLYMNEGMGI